MCALTRSRWGASPPRAAATASPSWVSSSKPAAAGAHSECEGRGESGCPCLGMRGGSGALPVSLSVSPSHRAWCCRRVNFIN
eukprot:scaffold11867_cov60-Phaeocystis_antarctica.AAC.4